MNRNNLNAVSHDELSPAESSPLRTHGYLSVRFCRMSENTVKIVHLRPFGDVVLSSTCRMQRHSVTLPKRSIHPGMCD